MGLGILMAVVALPWASGSPSLSCRTAFFWEWVGMVSDLEGEVSNSSQFHSSISESGYSSVLTSESSRLRSQLVAESFLSLPLGSSLSLSGRLSVGCVLPKAVVVGGFGASPVWFVMPKLVRLSQGNRRIKLTPWSRLVGGVYSLSLILLCAT